MGKFLGNEISQTRLYQDPNAKQSLLDYKDIFPITVFDAVRASMGDPNSQTLKEVLDYILEELPKKQTIIPNLPSSYLVTYAGAAGKVSNIGISTAIPTSITEFRSDMIPTEKAVGELLSKLGLIDGAGTGVVDPNQATYWTNIIGKPENCSKLGDNSNAFINQKALSEIIESIKQDILSITDLTTIQFSGIQNELQKHLKDTNNPHKITIEALGGISEEAFTQHLSESNPHHVSVYDLGLENVDNTSDEDKPISKATQQALDALRDLIIKIGTEGSSSGNIEVTSIRDIDYDINTCKLTVSMMDGSEVATYIPINDLVSSFKIDKENRKIIVTKLNGTKQETGIDDLLTNISGSDGANIFVEIERTPSGRQVVKARIKPGTITDNLFDPDLIQRIIDSAGVDGFVLTNACIHTIHIEDGAVTSEKIAKAAITNEHLSDDLVIKGSQLFTTDIPNSVLAIRKASGEAEWSKIITEMLDDAIITNEKIADQAVTDDKIADLSISGSKLRFNPKFQGTPSITISPDPNASNDQIPDTQWIRDRLDQYVARSKNIGTRAVRAEHLFSSGVGDEILATFAAGSDPVWTKIHSRFIEDYTIISRNIAKGGVNGVNLADSAVTSEKLFTSDTPYLVLGVVEAGGHPVYTPITSEFLPNGVFEPRHLQDRSVELTKLATSDKDFQILGVDIAGSDPKWMQIHSKLIPDRTIIPRHLFTSEVRDRILGVTVENDDPHWVQVNGEMIEDQSINQDHLQDKSITRRHLNPDIIGPEHIPDRSIPGVKLKERTIGFEELFTSHYKNRVLGVRNAYDHPEWMELSGEVIEDQSISYRKLSPSTEPYRVLASIVEGKPLKFIQIDSRYVANRGIDSLNLKPDLELAGSPTLAKSPMDSADDNYIPDTGWVRRYVNSVMNELANGGPIVVSPFIPDRSINGDKLVEDIIIPGTPTLEKTPPRDSNGNDIADTRWVHRYVESILYSDNVGVLAIEKGGEEPHYTKVNETLIADEAISSDKLQGGLELRGPARLEKRPAGNSGDITGTGALIPDCQWVLDRIAQTVFDLNIPKNNGCCCPSKTSDWMEIAQSRVDGNWITGGDGETIADDMEISEDAVRVVWDLNGSGDVEHDEAEISKETIDFEWEDGGSGDVEIDYTPGPFPGGQDPTDRGENGSGNCGDCNSDDDKSCGGCCCNLPYEIIENKHLKDHIIDGSKLFSSSEANVFLSVDIPGSDPKWRKISHEILGNDIIGVDQIIDGSVTVDKLDPDFMERIREIESKLGLSEDGYNEFNIPRDSINNSHIIDHSITGKKLARETEIPAYTTVEPQTDYERKSVRNIIISHRTPRGGSNGDIWMQYY